MFYVVFHLFAWKILGIVAVVSSKLISSFLYIKWQQVFFFFFLQIWSSWKVCFVFSFSFVRQKKRRSRLTIVEQLWLHFDLTNFFQLQLDLTEFFALQFVFSSSSHLTFEKFQQSNSDKKWRYPWKKKSEFILVFMYLIYSVI